MGNLYFPMKIMGGRMKETQFLFGKFNQWRQVELTLGGRGNIRNADISHKVPSQETVTWCFPNRKSSTRKWCVALAEELHSFCRSLICFFQNLTVFEKTVKFLSCDFHFPKQWGHIHAVLVVRSSGPISDPQVTCGVGVGLAWAFATSKPNPSAKVLQQGHMP